MAQKTIPAYHSGTAALPGVILRTLLLCLILPPLLMPAVSSSMHALILDSRSEVPVPGVEIIWTEDGRTSGPDGYFVLPPLPDSTQLSFRHIGYEQLTLSVAELTSMDTVLLKPRTLPFEELVKTEKRRTWLEEDLGAPLVILKGREQLRMGVEDAAAVLRADASVQIEENADGDKAVSIRGSNPDEVFIIYDGMRLNHDLDGSFDLSMLNIYDIGEYQVMKGAGTVLYGSGAFGGVVAMESRETDSEHLEFFSRYDNQGSRQTALNLYSRLGGNHLKIALTEQDLKQVVFGDSTQKTVRFFNVHDRLSFGHDKSRRLSWSYMYFERDYSTWKDIAPAANTNLMSRLQYDGSLLYLKDVQLAVDYRSYVQKTNQFYYFGTLSTKYDNQSVSVSGGKTMEFGENTVQIRAEHIEADFSGVSGRQMNHLELDYRDDMTKSHSGAAAVWKYSSETDSDLMQRLELNGSLRYDDIRIQTDKEFLQDEWPMEHDSTLHHAGMTTKAGFSISSSLKTFQYRIYALNGSNIRYPTLDQIYRRNYTISYLLKFEPLLPEKLSSRELGLELSFPMSSSDMPLKDLSLNAAVYTYNYSSKIYEHATVGYPSTPVNSQGSSNSGWELNLSALSRQGFAEYRLGFLKLDISDPRVLPNKPEDRIFGEVLLHFPVVDLKARYFEEGAQYFMYRESNGIWHEGSYPGRNNLDLYASVELRWTFIRADLGISQYNVLSADSETHYLDRKISNIFLNLSF